MNTRWHHIVIPPKFCKDLPPNSVKQTVVESSLKQREVPCCRSPCGYQECSPAALASVSSRLSLLLGWVI